MTTTEEGLAGQVEPGPVASGPVAPDELDRVFVHPRGLCESADVGAGTRIWAFAHVMAGARVGRDCNVGECAFIESGAWIGDRVTVKNAVLVWDRVSVGDDVFLGPGVVFTNDRNPRAEIKKSGAALDATVVRAGATVGANVTIVAGTTLGAGCFVAAGSVVTRDVGAYALVMGNPARRVGWSCRCGERMGPGLRCACGRGYEPEPGSRPPSLRPLGAAACT